MRRYVGLPFVDGGRGPDSVDCWGLVCLVYRECLGIDLPPYGDVSAHNLRVVSRSFDAGKDGPEWVQVETPQQHDVALMRLPSSGRAGHVGVYDGAGRILHAEKASGTMLESVKSTMIASRIIGYWRHV